MPYLNLQIRVPHLSKCKCSPKNLQHKEKHAENNTIREDDKEEEVEHGDDDKNQHDSVMRIFIDYHAVMYDRTSTSCKE